jgi:hypothetical protein
MQHAGNKIFRQGQVHCNSSDELSYWSSFRLQPLAFSIFSRLDNILAKSSPLAVKELHQ